jgi:hypothetical protein
MEGDGYPMGPNAVKEAKRLGQTSVVVGLSSYAGNQQLWQDLADYFYIKDKFYAAEGGLKQVLQERFGIK